MSEASWDLGPDGPVERGQVMYLAHAGQLTPVMARGVSGRRVTALGLDGGERSLAAERFYWMGQHRVDDVAALRTYWAKVQAGADAVDLHEAWRRLTASQQAGAVAGAGGAGDAGGAAQTVETVETVEPTRLAQLAVGGTDGEQVDAVVLAIFRDPSRFKVKRGQVQVASPEAVEAAERAAREEAEREQRLAWATAALRNRLGEGEAPDGPAEAVEAAARDGIEALIDLATFGAEGARSPQALALLEQLERRPAKADPGPVAFDLLVTLGELSRDDNLFVRRAGVPMAFPAEVLAEAEELARRAQSRREGVGLPSQRAPADMTGLLTIAVDDAATTEVDDAFAVEGNLLHVFVADVAAIVPRGSQVDAEAQRRASTLYLPEGKVPMMPAVLAEGACSLQEGEVRPALCFTAEVLSDGRLGFLEIREALCRVDRRVTYDQADAVLAGPAGASGLPDEVASLVRRGAAMMDLHRQHRTRNGSLSFQRSEIVFEIAPDGTVDIVRGDPNGPGRRLVSEMMVAVCAATGGYCRERGLPCVYRVQPAPDVPLPKVDAASLGPAEQVSLLRTLKPSGLTTRPAGHYSLGVDAYTQVTSPIRRYQDLLMHYQLKAVVRTGRPAMSDGQLLTLFSDVDKQAGVLRRVEQDSRRYWALRWLEQNPEAVLDGVVLRELGRGRVLVEIGALALQTPQQLARAGGGGRGRPRAGQMLRLKVAQVDARKDTLVLVEAT